MKKVFKKIGMVVIVIVALVIAYQVYIVISDKVNDYNVKKEQEKLQEERINAKTLMEYVKTHDSKYIQCDDENNCNTYNMAFTTKDFKCDALDNIKAFTSDYFITKDNEIYDISFNELYSNNQNCKKREIDKKIKDIKYENQGSYNRIIFLDSNNNVFYDDLTKYDEEHFSIQNKILKDNNIQMIFPSTIDTKLIKEYYKNDNFYQDWETTILVLKRDNKLYKQVYIDNSYYINNQYKHNINFKSEEIYKSLEEYGNIQQIAMSDYYSNNNGKSYKLEDNTITTIISDKGYYYLEEIKTDECIKYKDIECKLELKESEIYKRFSKDIKFIGEQYTILSDNSIIDTNYLTYPLDKDLKN
mgnify:FL=1